MISNGTKLDHPLLISGPDQHSGTALRVLSEVDQTLKLVKYVIERNGQSGALQGLQKRNLLPPDQLFITSVADANGDIVASTRPFRLNNIASERYFSMATQSDQLWVGSAQQNPETSEQSLQFSRRINAANGEFAGVVVVTVAINYFVSGYEASTMGSQGLLGLLGDDGRFRVRRCRCSCFSCLYFI